MTLITWQHRIALGVLVCLVGLSVARGEVSTNPIGSQMNTLVLGLVVDDPDPITIWLQYRPVPVNQVLNPDGDARGDGRPDIVFMTTTEDPDPIGAWPVAVWAYNAGADHDIAFSEWDGAAWTTTAFLTSTTEDELDPRVYLEADGSVHVVWWQAGQVERVYLATRPPGSSTWGVPLLVAAGRRPSVTMFNGDLVVGFERNSAVGGMAQDIMVATEQPGGGFAQDAVGSTTRTDRLDVQVHADQGHLWSDWKHDAIEFGCAEHIPGGGWTPVMQEPWTDPSWVGVEETRKAIRGQVLQ